MYLEATLVVSELFLHKLPRGFLQEKREFYKRMKSAGVLSAVT